MSDGVMGDRGREMPRAIEPTVTTLPAGVHQLVVGNTASYVAAAPIDPPRPSYAELEAILEQVRAFARQPDARVEDGYDPQFAAGDARRVGVGCGPYPASGRRDGL